MSVKPELAFDACGGQFSTSVTLRAGPGRALQHQGVTDAEQFALFGAGYSGVGG